METSHLSLIDKSVEIEDGSTIFSGTFDKRRCRLHCEVLFNLRFAFQAMKTYVYKHTFKQRGRA